MLTESEEEQMRTLLSIVAGVARTAFASMAIVLFVTSAPASGQVILEPDPTGTMTGTVGLTTSAGQPAETFSSGNVSSSGGGFSYSASFGSDGEFTIKVPADLPLRVYAEMYGFQNAPNAYLTHELYNIAAVPKDGTASIDMTRAGGRILAKVNVAGGVVQYLWVQSSSNDSAVSAYFRGSVSGSSTSGSAEVIQPMPARPNTQVYGSVTVRLPAGCTKTLSLPAKQIEVIAGTTAAVIWEGSAFDVTGQACPKGNVAGTITLGGLTGSGATKNYDYVYVSGPDYRSVSTTTGAYEIRDLATGNYSTQLQTVFYAPYNAIAFPYKSNAFTIQEGQTTVYDHVFSVGTARFNFKTRGSWSTADAYSGAFQLQHSTLGSYGWDVADPVTGNVDFVLEAGKSYLNYFYHAFYDQFSSPGRYFYQSLNHYPGVGSGRPEGVVAEGGQTDLGVYEHETSSSTVVFQAAVGAGLAPILLRDIQLSGTANLMDATGALRERSDLYGSGYGTETSAITVKLRGVPGTYQMQATASDAGGTRYRKSFELILGAPANTPAGSEVEQSLTTATGATIVALTFDNITQAGTTTISEATAGPNPPANFAIFKSTGVNGNTGQFYYDIITTAVFTGQVQVCLTYDETKLNTPEGNLELGHYLDATQTWEIITQDGYPDTTNNRICGLTSSFSLFAGLEPLDKDGDGVVDAQDNCPALVNAAQADFDGDGVGDACDVDSDGDNIVNSEDKCPSKASSDNGDLDNDGLGNPCDSDSDGDTIGNENDNCALVANPDQADFDLDGSGDQCDPDDDADGHVDAVDACPGTTPGSLIDGSGCASAQLFAQVCPITRAYRNHGEYVSCVANEASRQVNAGMMTEDQKDAVISAAGQSAVAKKK